MTFGFKATRTFSVCDIDQGAHCVSALTFGGGVLWRHGQRFSLTHVDDGFPIHVWLTNMQTTDGLPDSPRTYLYLVLHFIYFPVFTINAFYYYHLLMLRRQCILPAYVLSYYVCIHIYLCFVINVYVL